LKRPGLPAPRAWTLLLAAGAAVLATGCALFQDLDSSPYQLVDAGGVDCGADVACPKLSLGCTPPCPSDAPVCCVTVPSKGPPVPTCTATSSACTTAQGGLSVALCTQSSDCSSGTCVSQTCTFGGIQGTVQACGTVATCTPN
jgi:hypothetical protein